MHKIELRNIKVAEYLSEETTAFSADIYIDGKKVGYAKNDGDGGCTDYHGNTKEDNQLIAECEEEFKKLPEVKAEHFDFMYQPIFENYIDDLLEAHLKEKANKKLEKAMEKAILCETPNGYCEHFWTQKIQGKKQRVLLKDLATAVLKAKVDALKKSGEKILNTNIVI